MLFQFEKRHAILTTFLTLPTINCGEFIATYNVRWPCYRWRPLLSCWYPCNHESKGVDARGERNHCERRLMPWIQMNILIWLLLCWGLRLRVVCGEGVSRCIEDHAVSSVNLFVICYIGWFCIVFMSLPHIRCLEYFITSSSFINGWRRSHGAFYNFFDVHVVCIWRYIQLAQT